VKQRNVFVAVAALVAVVSAFGLRASASVEVAALAVCVLLLGVPHGSLDVLHARHAHGLDRPSRWLGFVAVYVLIGAGVVGAWSIAPAASLVSLLGISVFHFGGDLRAGSPGALRLVHGLAPICLPAMLHGEELRELFGALAPGGAAAALAAALEAAAPVVLLASLLLTSWAARRHRGAALEVAATAAICSVAPPLVGFGVYFCLLHAWRHVDRTRKMYAPTARVMAWAAGAPTLATAALGVMAFVMLEPARLEVGLLQVVFVGLAALTVPHMLLIERIRLGGWRTRDVSPSV
jgi:Brp/Blh family beta-carotene 15,15'-monooxygenase